MQYLTLENNMNKIFEYKNRGTRKGNIYYLIDDDTIEIEIENNNNEKVSKIPHGWVTLRYYIRL